MRNCKNCGKEVTTRHKQVVFCSHQCFSDYSGKDKKIEVKCDNCGKINLKLKSRIKNTNFCNALCQHQYRKENPPHKKDGYWFENGYKVLYTVNGDGIKEHIQIMEAHIGRKLTRDECVHHINEIRTDNRLENLLLTTRSKHTSIHRGKLKIEPGASLIIVK